MAVGTVTAGLHPAIVPSSVLKMNGATPDFVPVAVVSETTKPDVPLKTTPVGAATVPAALAPGGGIVTTSGAAGGKGIPAPVYSVEKPLPFSEMQNRAGWLWTLPQAFTRCNTVTLATP